MYLLPFIFFLGLTIYWWREHGMCDVCVYMSGLYALMSGMGVALILTDCLGEGGIAFENFNATFGLVPTLLFCGVIGLSLLPFSMIYGKDLKRITIHNPLAVDLFSWVLIAEFALNLYLVADSTMDILQGDLGQLRSEHYAGMETPAALKAETLNYALRVFYYFHPATILALPLFFFNICFRKKPWWFNLILALTSLSYPIAGIQTADRTETIFLAQMAVFCIIFFRPFFSPKIKRILLIGGLPIMLLGATYFSMVSESRFDKHQKTSSTIRNFQYAGQGYLNFCYFYEHGNFDYFAPEREFPLYNHFVNHVDSNDDRRNQRQGEQGFFMSIFATFAGDIMLDLGPQLMVVWVICYFLLCMMVVGRAHLEEIEISKLLVIFMLAVIPVFGIFYYRYFAFQCTFMMVLVAALYFISHYRFTFRKQITNELRA